ncbi:uncharacterized protein LOC134260435 [Saccostrea cucullata]|uniref:uncharacterized protein LOC134260435 n=1 Tax=Saccostrea cuccullata TaxID=36930 RepID=UPI002ECFFA3D
MLIDTGSAVSLISKEVLDNFDLCDQFLQRVSTELKTADGEPLQVYGQTEITFILGGREFSIPVIVAELGDLSGILGLDFLSENEVIFDLKKGVLNFPEFKVQLESEDNLSCARVSLDDDTVISGSTETFVKCNLGNSRFRCLEGIVEPHFDKGLDQNILIPKSLVNVKEGNILFSVLNPNPEPVQIKKNTQVATIQSIMNATDLVNKNKNFTHTDVDVTETKCLPDHLKIMMENVSCNITETEKSELSSVLSRYEDIFVGLDGKLGRTNKVEHTINTGESKPIKLPPRRLPLAQKEIAEKEIKNMLDQDIIETSSSPWASPIVLVQKKDGSTRFCVD